MHPTTFQTTINDMHPTEVEELTSNLEQLMIICRSGSIAKGFGAEGDAVRAEYEDAKRAALEYPKVGEAQTMFAYAEQRLTDYYSKRLLLIVEEVTEAFGEIRSGLKMDQTYYSHANTSPYDPSLRTNPDGSLRKPEGVPSELADIVIRCFDLAAEAKIDLAAMIVIKLMFNATRPALHGRKF